MIGQQDRQTQMTLATKLIILFVWGIILFEVSSFLFLFVPNFYHYHPLTSLVLIVPFVLIVTLLCISYFKSIYCSPGYSSFQANTTYSEEIQEIKLRARKESELKKEWRKQARGVNMEEIRLLNTVSYCFRCDLIKEERVHHCRICERCVLRMDHHCPWVGNCVGKLNHKYFILFLLYATTGLLTVAISFTIDYLQGEFYALLLEQPMYYVYYMACITSYMLAASIGFLFVTQVHTTASNITTLESFTSGIQQHVDFHPTKNPFQRHSVLQNFREIFGQSNWLLPTNPFPKQSHNSTMTIDAL